MSLLRIQIKNQYKKTLSNPDNTNLLYSNSTNRKETPLCASTTASITIEAAIALPLFVICILSVIFLFRVLELQQDVEYALQYAARKSAIHAHMTHESVLDSVVPIAEAKILFQRKLEELKAPVMIQTTPSTVKYGTVDTYAAIVAAEAKKASVPVCLQLDHGSSYELAMQAIHAGYTSVMIDGSKLDFEANIAETKRVADVANALDIPCEAELGKVGGKDDDLEAEADTISVPQEAKEFVERTGVTSLAVAIGTAHGFYVGTPVLDKERLSEIREVVDIPLVLHGASGLSDEDVMDCVKRGICKVNFATELRAAYSRAVKEPFAENENTIDPKAYGKKAIQAVKELVEARMKVCGCDGKAE